MCAVIYPPDIYIYIVGEDNCIINQFAIVDTYVSLTYWLGHTSTTQLEAAKNTTTSSRVKDPRVTSSQTFTSTNPRGESKPMQQNAMARTHEVFKSFTLKFQQSNKCLWGNKRGTTMVEKHKELQDQDLLGSPHLEERWIGGNVDLDLLSRSEERRVGKECRL